MEFINKSLNSKVTRCACWSACAWESICIICFFEKTHVIQLSRNVHAEALVLETQWTSCKILEGLPYEQHYKTRNFKVSRCACWSACVWESIKTWYSFNCTCMKFIKKTCNFNVARCACWSACVWTHGNAFKSLSCPYGIHEKYVIQMSQDVHAEALVFEKA